MGHGHVTPNPDGSLARCGGPAICEVCAREKAALQPKKQSWTKEMREEIHDLKGMIRLRGLADYIAMTFMEHEQNELIKLLQDQTKQLRIRFEVTDRIDSEEES